MVSRGFFVIADISGYTEFLTQSGLEEAQSILDHLYSGFLQAYKPPLIISNFQGDAVLAYAPDGSFIQGQTFFELLEGLYFTFVGLVERMERSAACSCDACDNLPKLDLKIFVHYGQYTIQKIRDREELTGPDLIITHRMMKNSVREETGFVSYALFTEQALKRLDLFELTVEMHSMHVEYEHLGSVKMFAYDLRPRYEMWKIHQRIFVRPDQAEVTLERNIAAQPHIVWEFLTLPQYIKNWMTFESVIKTDEQSPRLDRGTVFRCVRKSDNIEFTITDWRPFEYFTMESVGEAGVPFEATYTFLQSQQGTVLKLYIRNRQVLEMPPEGQSALLMKYEFERNLDQLEILISNKLHSPAGRDILVS